MFLERSRTSEVFTGRLSRKHCFGCSHAVMLPPECFLHFRNVVRTRWMPLLAGGILVILSSSVVGRHFARRVVCVVQSHELFLVGVLRVVEV